MSAISREGQEEALPLLPLDFFRHYRQYAAGHFSEFRSWRVIEPVQTES
jgi:hypothetical protein